MLFSSATFLFCFLPMVLAGYHLIRRELRGIFLLLASLLFYAWSEPVALVVLLGVALLSYAAAPTVAWAQKKDFKPLAVALMSAAILLDIGVLVYFKYTNFLIEIFNGITGRGLALQQILLPVGISFFVFQSIAYLVDVYRGKIPAEKNLLRILLYFAMFQKLTQGPIMRYGAMEEDLKKFEVTTEDLSEGARRFIIGLTKKLLIADVLGGAADGIFGLAPASLSTPLAWGGIVAYSLQIYFDFSGYSDMAVGLGRLFGFHLMENFKHPYAATSITDFWRRWHISLSTWFKDYLYIPLGGNRRGNQYFNIFMVFLATGLWHGSAWTYVIWGLLHGVLRMAEKFLTDRGIRQKIPTIINRVLTILLVMIGWVFFRANTLESAMAFIKAMFGFGGTSMFTLEWYYNAKVILVTLIGIVAAVPWKEAFPQATERLKESKVWLVCERVLLVGMLALCILLAMTSTYTSFIYFQF